MKSKKYIEDWLKALRKPTKKFDDGIDQDEIVRIETAIEVLECILQDETEELNDGGNK